MTWKRMLSHISGCVNEDLLIAAILILPHPLAQAERVWLLTGPSRLLRSGDRRRNDLGRGCGCSLFFYASRGRGRIA